MAGYCIQYSGLAGYAQRSRQSEPVMILGEDLAALLDLALALVAVLLTMIFIAILAAKLPPKEPTARASSGCRSRSCALRQAGRRAQEISGAPLFQPWHLALPGFSAILCSEFVACHRFDRMKDLQGAPGIRTWGWIAVLAVAGLAHVSCALAQIYKCTDADGRTAFADNPCATPPPGAAGSAGTGRDGVKQEVLRQPKTSAGNTSADAISAMWPKV